MKKITVQVRVHETSLDGFDRELDVDVTQNIDTERLILSLNNVNEVQVLLLRYMGFNYKEIMKIMNLKSQGEYYHHWMTLRKDVERIKNA